ncbi:MAG: hypothetical protein DCC65_11230 [Planctomycetota bacterium]|nr:MAG: hypothetical protein DCC65_11230 [Planctomycetota bacterium]
MKNFAYRVAFWVFVAGFLTSATAAPAEETAVSQPAATDGSLVYEVVDITGRVKVGATGIDPLRDEGWTPVQKGDMIRAGQQVRVGLRSRVKLVARPAEPPTVLLFDTASLINISELALQGGEAKSRMELAYGTIKAGVAEGEVRSNMEIAGPTATLSKKGTDIFSFDVQPDGRFFMGLSEQGRGLVQGIMTQAGAFGGTQVRSRFLTPGQWITQQMARAIDNVQFDRKVLVNDVYGLEGIDQLFTLLNDRGGISFMLPAGNSAWSFFGNNGQQAGPLTLPQTGLQGQDNGTVAAFLNQGLQPVRHNNGGDFGIGQGQVPGVFSPARRIPAARDGSNKVVVQRGGGYRR